MIETHHNMARSQANVGKKFAAAQKVVEKAYAEFAKDVVKIMKKEPYPPERPGQRYVRTYKLRGGFRYRQTSPTIFYVWNVAKGRKYAVSEKWQAWMHRGRWWTIEEIIERERPAFAKRIKQQIRAHRGGR